jgi:type III pantothenate kinase
MNCLTVDVGNSQLAFVLYQHDHRLESLRIRTHPHPSTEEFVETSRQLLSRFQLTSEGIHLAVSSVVPNLKSTLITAAEKLSPLSFHWVSWDSPHQFEASSSAKREIGADLIAGLVAARLRVTGPFVVVDCGTATTLTLVNQDNLILGVAILPGLVTQMHSLTHSAPHLPQEVSLRPPPQPYGNDTKEALQSGILYGHAASIEGILTRYRGMFAGSVMTSLACGGLFHRISSLCPSIDIEEVELVNVGCRVLAQRQLQEGL